MTEFLTQSLFLYAVLFAVTSLKCYDCMDENDCVGTEMMCPPEKSKCGAITLFSYDGILNIIITYVFPPL